jgi:hypothetical protein
MSNAKVTMEAIKAKLREASEKKGNSSGPKTTGGDKTTYPFWNIPQNSSALVRFLPDADPDNVFFWVKKETIKLPFSGSVGGEYATEEEVEVTVPCIDMFNMSCPITAHIRPWWKDEEKKPLARVYYKKPAFIFQGFVVQSPFEEQELPENPIRKFSLNRSIYEIVEQSLLNPDMEDSPVDYVAGRDFKLSKTQKGDYANYSTSSWSFRTRSLNEQEAIAIEQHGLFDLKESLGRRPDQDEVEMIKAMFQDSLDGRPFDNNSYGHLYRAFKKRGGDNGNNAAVAAARSAVGAGTTTSAQVPSSYQRPAVQQESHSAPAQTYSAPAEDAAPAAAAQAGAPADKPSAHDILERIKNRQAR